ncbi:MAG: phospholipid/cholesterol/gamma-HCH transport system permease protein [Solirubrobacteraceae bacterium]|nr:phospholipid/cholesterol/gamma-HCH transport system permease protein [Solirubrobacteraceae bacterium]
MAERARIRSGLTEAGDLAAFGARAVRALPGVPRFASEALRHAGVLVRGSTLFIFVMTAFIGFAQTTFAFFFLRSAGASDYLAFFTGITTPRAAAPIMFGYVFAAKVGCAMVAEIGTARINEEIDALETEAIDPMRYIVGTRIVGALLFVPIAVGVALLAVTVGSYVDGVIVLQALPGATFLNNHWAAQTIADQGIALLSLGTMGMAIVIVACFFGYRASGGPAGVGRAVAKSIVVNLVLVHVIASFYLGVFYGQDLKLPIGG